MANKQWYFSKGDDHQQGPVSVQELNRLAESGELKSDDLIWKEGMDEWLPASRMKGLTFAGSSTGSQTSPESKPFDAESIKSTFRDAKKMADEATGFLWFLDLKFSRLVSATIIRVVWTIYLVLVALMLVLGLVVGLLRYPILEAMLYFVASVIGSILWTLMFRVVLEGFMVIFHIAEHVREMKEKLEPE